MRIVVGSGSCGIAAGADRLYALIDQEIRENKLVAKLEITGCIGTCYLEPILEVYANHQMKRFTRVSETDMKEILEQTKMGTLFDDNVASDSVTGQLEKQNRIVLRNCGVINPESIEDYIRLGGYEAIEKCIREKSPKEIIEEIKISGLRGRGGAGFPTWFKWNAALQSPGDIKYMVCNADEGDPGAFMDRSVLEGIHSLIEGMMIAGYAIGAKKGIVYVRAEYPLAIVRLEKAIKQAKAMGILGKDIFGIKGNAFDLSIKTGAGAFVCGEETALIASLEGERGMPRLKPPFPAQRIF